jgi:23S rRNA maturation mini-RNase III
MSRRALLTLAALMLSLLLAAHPVFAIFGFGDIVFDPSVYAEAIEQVLQLERQYAQLVQTYEMAQNQYEHLKRMAKRVPVDMVARYKAPATPWLTSSAANTYGTTDPWTSGINTGVDARTGYAGAVQRLDAYGEALGNVPSDQQARIKTDYATVELTDGANVAAIETIGRMRSDAHAVETAIAGLETDTLSADPDMNTEIAVLNKINVANVMAIRSAQDTNKLLVALAEEQVIDAKRKRDAEAAAINQDIRFRREGKAVLSGQVADASAAIRSWRLP